MDKLVESAEAAVADIPDGATLLVGGFGLCGIPENLIAALSQQGRARPDRRLEQLRRGRLRASGLLLRSRQIRKMISTYVGREPDLRAAVPDGRARGRARPAGHLRRAHPRGGAGHPGLLHADRLRHAGGERRACRRCTTARGASLRTSEPKETREFDGRSYVMERAIRGDFALGEGLEGRPRAATSCTGRTARNFNPIMATAAPITIAEVEQVVGPGRAAARLPCTRRASSCSGSCAASGTRSASSSAP
jgi:acyl CoA:acetate/3-ketoacid CoA transferase alpha subunit